jgi:co-chaperonin GroES (HSP10)
MSLYTVKGDIRAIGEDILVADMHFGEIKTQGGIIVGSDDAKSRGVKPRWAKVYRVGPDQDLVKEGDWILIEHGRWTRKVKIDNGDGEIGIQKIDPTGVLGIHDGEGEPDMNYLGEEYSDGESYTVDPGLFMDQ